MYGFGIGKRFTKSNLLKICKSKPGVAWIVAFRFVIKVAHSEI
jgi:hypothetical protein